MHGFINHLEVMNKSITLSPSDWETVIEGLSYANVQAEDEFRDDDAETYMRLIDLLTEMLNS